MADFKVGDKVRNVNGEEGAIVFGPYDTRVFRESYLVRREDGTHFSRPAQRLTLVPPAPAFAVGDKVRYFGRDYTLAAGPFDPTDSPWWVVQREDGAHVTAGESEMTLVEGADAQHLVTVGGVEYDIRKRYRDCDGDVWHLAVIDGDVVGAIDRAPGRTGERLEWAARVYGPMIPVAD
ncbi:hypothetical protein ABZY06_33825 [Streptomyces sp. NPDC006540]|uniref:hypothetical protein n=1 Tax=Streptomyces sp. NPDC006540 TaxID=3155353 RepID=UPI00339FA761